ncbi:MAG TPA: hypothetical protein VJR89_16350 [Polyangiales bacterium]|nr:hypothetical protein [Polyangiales bacterium]
MLRPRDGTWDPGSYRLELDFDDASHSCALTVPDDLPPTAGTPVQLRCEPQLEASLSAEVTCTEQRTSGGSSQSCTPLAGRFRLDVRRDGTPELLRIQIERDAAAVFAHDQQLEYEESRPNGPDCEPLCRQAELDLFF